MYKVWRRVLTGTPPLCVCVSGSPTGHRLRAAGPPSRESLRCRWSHTWRNKKRRPSWLKDTHLGSDVWMRRARNFPVLSFAFFVLVDVVFDGQQVVAHGLEGELVQDGRDGVKRPVQDDQLWASLVWTLRRDRQTAMSNKNMRQQVESKEISKQECRGMKKRIVPSSPPP